MKKFQLLAIIWIVLFPIITVAGFVDTTQVHYSGAELIAKPNKNCATVSIPLSCFPAPPPAPPPPIIDSSLVYVDLNLGDLYRLGSDPFTASVNIRIVLTQGMTLLQNVTRTLVLTEVKARQVWRISMADNAGGLAADNIGVQIISTSISASSGVQQMAIEERLQLFVRNVAYYRLPIDPTASQVTLNSAYSPGITDNPVTLKWEKNCQNVEYYQVQILRLFNIDPNFATAGEETALVDWSQALTIETKDATPEITLTLAEGKGYYAWRVRAINEYYSGGFTNPKNFGGWSTHTGYTDSAIINIEYSTMPLFVFFNESVAQDKNWQYARSFGEEQQLSDGIRFLNGLNMVVQEQTADYVAENRITTTYLQDFMGRTALRTLPVPISDVAYTYETDVLKTPGGALYTVNNFDTDAKYREPDAAGSSSLVATYYGAANTDLTIPMAEGYPFSRNLFVPESTPKLMEMSGFGFYHRIQSNYANRRTVQKLYGSVSDQELILLFGDEAPADTTITKEVTIDENHVVTVQYTDREGRIIATMISGSSGDNLDPLPGSNNSMSITDKITGYKKQGDNSLVSSKEFVFTESTTLAISYMLDPAEFVDLCAEDCHSCDYSMEISLYRTDVPGAPLEKVIVPKMSVDCGQDPVSNIIYETVPIGSYLLQRVVSANQSNSGVTYIEKLQQDINDEVFGSTNWQNILNSLTAANLSAFYLQVTGSTTPAPGSNYNYPVGCCSIDLTVVECPKEDCGKEADWEKYFFDYYKYTDVPTEISGEYPYFFAYGADNHPTYYQKGDINLLIQNMLNAGYSCDLIWKCWKAVVEAYGEEYDETFPESPATRYNMQVAFLECTGYLFNENCATTDEKLIYEEAYSYFYAESSSIYDHCASGCSEFSEPADYCLCLMRCVRSLQDGTHISFPNPTEIDDLVTTMVAGCEESCEQRFFPFLDALKQQYVAAGYTIVGDPETVCDTFTPAPYISLYDLYCQAQMLVDNCKDFCQLTIQYDGSNPIGVGSLQELENFMKARYYNFEVALPEEEECTNGFELVSREALPISFLNNFLSGRLNEILTNEYLPYTWELQTELNRFGCLSSAYCGPEIGDDCTPEPHPFSLILSIDDNVSKFRVRRGNGGEENECQLYIDYLTVNDVVVYTHEITNFYCSDDCLCIPRNCGSVCFRWVEPETEGPYTSIDPINCEEQLAENYLVQLTNQLWNCVSEKQNQTRNAFYNNCLEGELNASLEVSYQLKYHHYTLYYYDRAGNLVRTVAPNGVIPTATSRASMPDYDYKNTYAYSSTGQLLQQYTPDGGKVTYYYNTKGQLRFSQNAKQLAAGVYAYTLYDDQGRIVEMGESNQNIGSFPTYVNTDNYPTSGKQQLTTTVYTTPYSITNPRSGKNQENLRNRISYITSPDGVITVYSYDLHGNVIWSVQHFNEEVPEFFVNYDFELISGNMKGVQYNPHREDNFYHRYRYDANNRLEFALSSTDSLLWDMDAHYLYYKHGPLRRVELGQDSIQGNDRVYTLNGWLKGLNHPTLLAANDPGGDGLQSPTSFTRDVWGQQLNYFNGDFNHTGSIYNDMGGDAIYYELWNGNIAGWSFQGGSSCTGFDPEMAYYDEMQNYWYYYDQLNRMRVSEFGTQGVGGYPGTWSGTSNYFMELSYDANGNITDLYRYGIGSDMDQLTYNYLGGDNQLNYISDAVMSSGYPYDIRDQQPDNYQYDGIGNMTSDTESGINNIYWNAYGKVTEVQTNDASIYYQYDGLGRRVRKRVEPVSGTTTTTWYILDAGGRNISTYTRADEVEETQQELSLYGGNRLGLYRREVQEWGAPYDKLNNPWPVYTRFINRRQYEITDHLGSTRVVVNDRAITTFSEEDGSVTYACADVLSLLNYYPGGQLQPGMTWQNALYRYGYNTQERSDEIYGPGNFYTAEFWEYDSRIWRRWNRDPQSVHWESPYAAFRNNPNVVVDKKGDIPLPIITGAIGAIAGAVTEIGSQVVSSWVQGKNVKDALASIDWADVGISTVEGAAIGAGVGPLGAKVAGSFLKASIDYNAEKGFSSVGGVVGSEKSGIDFGIDLGSNLLGNTIGRLGGGDLVARNTVRFLSKGSPGTGRVFAKLLAGEVAGGLTEGIVSGTADGLLRNARFFHAQKRGRLVGVRPQDMNIDGSIRRGAIVRAYKDLPTVIVKP